jgi:DNA modification methylase
MEAGMNKIICGDSAEILKTLEPDSIDLTVTSPPYDNLRTYNGYTFDFETIARELYRVTKPGGVVVWVVDDRKEGGSESGTSLRQALFFMEIGFNLHDKMIYRKLNGAMGAINEYLQEFEMMFVFSKGAPKTVNLLRDRRNAFHGDKTTPATKSDASGSLHTRKIVERDVYGRRKNIWEYAVGGPQEIGKHSAPFPKALARDHILSWSNPGDLVLDCFAGSGTTLKMAKETGRNWLGIEISPEYCRLIERRIAGANVPLPFFAQVQP